MKELKNGGDLNFLVEDNKVDERENLKKFTSNLVRFIFVCVFLVSSLIFICITLSYFDNASSTDDLKNYDSFILPLVMQDPEDFDEDNPPSLKTMLNTCIWGVAMDKKNDMSVYDENQDMIIRVEEIQNKSRNIFNCDIDIQSGDEIKENFYVFDEEKNVFKVKSISGTDRYTPYTASATKFNDEIILNVGYAIPCEQFTEDMTNLNKIKIDKYKTYRLKLDKDTDKMYICGVE